MSILTHDKAYIHVDKFSNNQKQVSHSDKNGHLHLGFSWISLVPTDEF